MISEEQLERVEALLSQTPIEAGVIDKLRAAQPDIHFTYCQDDDVFGVSPMVEKAGYNLYLVDSSHHCLALTRERRIATGILVAEVEPE